MYHAAAEAGLGAQAEEARVRYVPVSQISTPPTLTTTSRPYGEIVNQVNTAHDITRLNVSVSYLFSPQEFYSALSPVSRPRPAASRSKAARRVADTKLEQGVRPFPLGNPGHYTYYQV